MNKVVFFGLGAVGSVMACCLHELFRKDKSKNKIQFVFIVRDTKKAKQYLFRAPHVAKNSQFFQVDDFDRIFKNYRTYSELLKSDIIVNAASPDFNEQILKLSVYFKAHYCDLASVMGKYTIKTLKFEQFEFDKELKNNDSFGLINIGVSPGITNFLAGEKIKKLMKSSQIKINSVNLYLLEDIDSHYLIFSWSPKISLDELESKALCISNNKLISIKPFAHHEVYNFPHIKKEVLEEYPIFQEEVISLHDTFPKIKSLCIFTGGSDVELIRNLSQLNLLSKKNIQCVKNNMSIEQIVRMVLPEMKSPKKIEELNKKGEIKSANFSAMIEVGYYRGKKKMIDKFGLGFWRYSELLGTPYSGATYISYPTGVGAAILLFYTYQSWQENKQRFSGIIKAEELPEKMNGKVINEIKKKLSNYKIDFLGGEQ